jgi:hypothetical protein
VDDIPPELWSIIFDFSLDVDYICYDQWVSDVAGQAVACSHVCQFWRHVALNTSSLWTIIDLHHKGCEQFAVRSKLLPIYIACLEDYGPMDPSRYAAMGWLRSHVDHIEEFQLNGSPRFLMEVTSRMDSMFPMLRVFLLGCLDRRPTAGKFRLHLDALNLRKLCLSGIDLSSKMRPCSGLTSLSFRNLSASLTKLLFWLRLNPGLQSLSLSSLTIDSPLNDTTTPVVSLNHLEELVLDENLRHSSASLLGRIVIPTSAPLMRSCRNDPKEGQPANDIFASIAIDNCEYDPAVRFQMLVGGLSIFDGPQNDISPLLLAMSTSVDLSSIAELSIKAVCRGGQPIVPRWGVFFSGLSSLTTLSVYAVARWLTSIVHVLWPERSQAPCTQLQSLKLYLCEYDAGKEQSEESRTMGQHLLYHLQRCSSGEPVLRTLDVNFGDAATIKQLNQLVKV